jgi:hypothetical protein
MVNPKQEKNAEQSVTYVRFIRTGKKKTKQFAKQLT